MSRFTDRARAAAAWIDEHVRPARAAGTLARFVLRAFILGHVILLAVVLLSSLVLLKANPRHTALMLWRRVTAGVHATAIRFTPLADEVLRGDSKIDQQEIDVDRRHRRDPQPEPRQKGLPPAGAEGVQLAPRARPRVPRAGILGIALACLVAWRRSVRAARHGPGDPAADRAGRERHRRKGRSGRARVRPRDASRSRVPAQMSNHLPETSTVHLPAGSGEGLAAIPRLPQARTVDRRRFLAAGTAAFAYGALGTRAGVAFAAASIQAEVVQLSATVTAGGQLTIDQTSALTSLTGVSAPAGATFSTNQATAHACTSIAAENGMEIVSCAEEIDGQAFGIRPGKCIDPQVIADAFQLDVSSKKDSTQREACGCALSRDIGMYESCLFGCQYCYATKSFEQAKVNFAEHDIDRAQNRN